MRTRIFLLIAFLAFLASCSSDKYKIKTLKDSNGYAYEIVTNDPAGLRVYTLANGLKVYMAHNPAEPRIMGMIGVRAGSTSDPIETTGLAHYFEHIMFKGTSSAGTSNWEKEKPLLDSISALFEIYRTATDETRRKAIYATIDKLSFEASKFAIANEYDKMAAEMGALNTNAFTSYEVTAYMNDIPASELRRWLALEFDRFTDVVLRLFHTELETVYEEFNMYQDRDWSRASETLMRNLFPKHPLGRDVIGLPEHLKNPSMVNIMKFKETWYIPNNMAICLSGDLNMEEAIVMIDETFGRLESKPLPERPRIVEDPITSPIETDVIGPDAENLLMAWRIDNPAARDRTMAYIMANILYNGTAGLIDINLIQEQQVLEAYSYADFFTDYGMIMFSAVPRNEQTLEEARDLILQEIEKLKTGDFPDWMPTAIANQNRLEMLRTFEQNWRAYEFLNSFVLGLDWKDVISFPDKIEQVTKKQVTDYARNFFGNNYVAVFKRTGEATGLIKVPKPDITPVIINRDAQSGFYAEWRNIPRDTILPVFLDYSRDLQFAQLKPGIDLSYIPNTTNEFFTHYYIIDAGKNQNLKTPLAFNFLPFLGTENYSATELKQELFRYGLSTSVSSGNDRSWVYISGLNRNFEKGLQIMEEILTRSVPDTAAYRKYAERTIKERDDMKLNLDMILRRGLRSYATYGPKSPFSDVLSNQEIRNTNPAQLTELVKTHFSYPHRVFYYGPSNIDDVKSAVLANHNIPDELSPLPAEKQYPELNTRGGEVLFAHYDMSQVNIMLLGKGQPYSPDLHIRSELFNQYFGNSMSSIVFQELREAQGLAYSAWMGYNMPQRAENAFYLMGYIGTQPDKLEQATSSFNSLLTNLIENEQSFDISRKAILNTIATERIIKEQIFFQWLSNQRLGITSDIRKDIYNAAQTASMDDLRTFYNSYIKGTPYNYLIVGDRRAVDQRSLSRLGKVKELTLEEIFGF